MASQNAVQASAKDAMSALRDAAAKVGPVLRAYRRYLIATYGNATQTLADYGLEPPRARTPLTSAAQATAVLKLRATRKARVYDQQEAEGGHQRDSGDDDGPRARRAASAPREAGELKIERQQRATRASSTRRMDGGT